MKNLFLALTTTAILCACAHHDDVRPGENNQHYVVIKSTDRSSGIKEALDQAKDYCKQSDKNMYVINEDVDYQGEKPEQEYLSKLNTAEGVTEVGTWLWILGDGYVDDVAGVAAIGGALAQNSLGAPYVVTVNFRCTDKN